MIFWDLGCWKSWKVLKFAFFNRVGTLLLHYYMPYFIHLIMTAMIFMQSHHILPQFFLFFFIFQRHPRSSPQRTQANFTTSLEVSQIWKWSSKYFRFPPVNVGPQNCLIYCGFTTTGRTKRDCATASVFEKKTSHWETKKINCEGSPAYPPNLVNFGAQMDEI